MITARAIAPDDALAAFRYGVTAEVARAEGLALSIAGGDGQ